MSEENSNADDIRYGSEYFNNSSIIDDFACYFYSAYDEESQKMKTNLAVNFSSGEDVFIINKDLSIYPDRIDPVLGFKTVRQSMWEDSVISRNDTVTSLTTDYHSNGKKISMISYNEAKNKLEVVSFFNNAKKDGESIVVNDISIIDRENGEKINFKAPYITYSYVDLSTFQSTGENEFREFLNNHNELYKEDEQLTNEDINLLMNLRGVDRGGMSSIPNIEGWNYEYRYNSNYGGYTYSFYNEDNTSTWDVVDKDGMYWIYKEGTLMFASDYSRKKIVYYDRNKNPQDVFVNITDKQLEEGVCVAFRTQSLYPQKDSYYTALLESCGCTAKALENGRESCTAEQLDEILHKIFQRNFPNKTMLEVIEEMSSEHTEEELRDFIKNNEDIIEEVFPDYEIPEKEKEEEEENAGQDQSDATPEETITNNQDENKKSGLSGGAIVGIVFAVMMVIGIIALIVGMMIRKKSIIDGIKENQKKIHNEEPVIIVENGISKI